MVLLIIQNTFVFTDTSKGCSNDFQWIHNESKDNALTDMEQLQSVTKPPIHCCKQNKTPKGKKLACGNLDRRQHRSINHQEREQKSRSVHNIKSPVELDDYMYYNSCYNHQANLRNINKRQDVKKHSSLCHLIEQTYGKKGLQIVQTDYHQFEPDVEYHPCYILPMPCCILSDSSSCCCVKSYFPKV